MTRAIINAIGWGSIIALPFLVIYSLIEDYQFQIAIGGCLTVMVGGTLLVRNALKGEA